VWPIFDNINIVFSWTNFNWATRFLHLYKHTSIKIIGWTIAWSINIKGLFRDIFITWLLAGERSKIDISSENNDSNSNIYITKVQDLYELIISWCDKSKISSIVLDKYYISWRFNGLLLIYNLTVNQFVYKSSTITPNISINNVTFWKLDLDDVNLWKAILNNSIIKKLRLIGASFDGCKFNWCDLPSIIEDVDDNSIMKDSYRQLKFAMDNNGNHTEANKFFAKEMEYYEKTLGLEKKWLWWTLVDILTSVWFWWENKKRGERIALLFSDMITEHWSNLMRGLFFLFMFSLLSSLIATLYMYSWAIYCVKNGCNLEENLKVISLIFLLSVIVIFLVLHFMFTWFNKISDDNKVKKYFINNISKKFDIWAPIFLFLLIFLSWFQIDIIYWELNNYKFNSFKYFISLLDPTFWLFKNQISHFNNIELLFFILYKVFYGIILWHILVAARRTTRR